MRPAHRHGAIPLSRVAVGFALSVWMLSGGVARGQAFRTTGEGLNVGHFLLYPSVDFEYTDSDNVFYSSQDLPEDQIIKSGMTVVRPRILMDLPIGGNRIRWVYSPLYRDYTSKSFVQTQRFSHYFDFEALHTGPVVTVRGGYHLVLGTEELREVDRGGELVFGTTPFKAYVTEAEVTLSMGARNGISVLPLYNAVAFDDSTPNSLIGYRRRQIEIRFQHAVSLTSQVFAFYSHEDSQQDREQVLFGNVSYDARTAGLGLRRTLNREVVAFLHAGYKEMDFKGGSNSNFRGPAVDANATWQVSDVTVLALSGVHQAFQSFYINNNYYLDTEVRFRLTHQVGRNVFWDTSIGFLNNRYADPLDISVTAETPPGQDCEPMIPDPGDPSQLICGGDGRIDIYESLQPSVGRRRHDRLYRAEVGAGWQLSPLLRLFIGYNSERRRSNVEQIVSGQTVDPFAYSVNRILFRLEAGWQ